MPPHFSVTTNIKRGSIFKQTCIWDAHRRRLLRALLFRRKMFFLGHYF